MVTTATTGLVHDPSQRETRRPRRGVMWGSPVRSRSVDARWSVVVCAYTFERLELTSACVRAVLAQPEQPEVIVVTDHNVRETLRITDRAYIVNDGVIFRNGTPDQLAADEDVRRIYLGTDFRLD